MSNLTKQANRRFCQVIPMVKVKKGRQGEGGGQPPKYKGVTVLQVKILEYFEEANKQNKIFSKAGLLRKLEISRPQYAVYKKKYPNTIRQAEYAIEEVWVDRLTQTGATGAIFYLKNAFKEDYKDRTDHDITTSGSLRIDLFDYTKNVRKPNRRNHRDQSDQGDDQKDTSDTGGNGRE